jgi:hypothetical protein
MKLFVNITNAAGEILERFVVTSGDVRRDDELPEDTANREAAIAFQIRDLVEHRFEYEEAP